MSLRRIVIVCAGPAGLATACTYRGHDGAGEVTPLGKTLIPYRRPPLIKEFLRGELDASELPIQSRDWFDEHDNCDGEYEHSRQLIATWKSPP